MHCIFIFGTHSSQYCPLKLTPTDVIYIQIDISCYIRCYVIFKKYKTFSLLIYSYINTSGNWKNEKLCGNMTPAGWSVFTQFPVFPIFTSIDITVYQ